MNFTDVYKNSTSFSRVIVNQMLNDSDVERCGDISKYVNDDISTFRTTSQNLQVRMNFLLDKYFDKIKASCSKKSMSIEDNAKYRYRPEALSLDQYNIPGLWYLILRVNSCEDAMEFHDLPYVLIPDLAVVNSCIMQEEYILGKEAL